MVCDERLASFINSFNTDYDEVVTSIRREAEENRVPIIRREAGEFIKMLILMNRPKKILEIGSAVGFSAIFMSRFLDDDAHITTIENYQPRIEEAKKNIVRAGASDKITLLEGDALEILPGMTETMIWCSWMQLRVSMAIFHGGYTAASSEGGIALRQRASGRRCP